jgi:hypothetical protein
VRAREITRELARRSDSELELNLPDGVAKAGKVALEAGQRAIYGGLFGVKVTGKAFIPQNRNFLVVANHASHLDMGLVKVAMGEQGERLVALAARNEQALLQEPGLPGGRGWYLNMLYAPGRLTGYGAKTLPGVREAIEDERWADVETYTALTARALEMYAEGLEEGVRVMGR